MPRDKNQRTGKRHGGSRAKANPIPDDFEAPPVQQVFLESEWYKIGYHRRHLKFRKAIFLQKITHKYKNAIAYALSLQTGEIVEMWFEEGKAEACMNCLSEALSTDAGFNRRRFYYEAQECLRRFPGSV